MKQFNQFSFEKNLLNKMLRQKTHRRRYFNLLLGRSRSHLRSIGLVESHINAIIEGVWDMWDLLRQCGVENYE